MIQGIDHVAITVADLDAACDFYARVLGARIEEEYEIGGRIAVKRVRFGQAILNVHQAGNGVELVARQPQPGSTDICFRWAGDIGEAKTVLESRGVAVIEGPVPRTSADGLPASSVYFRDLDGNLVELLAS
jgi:catechol 2,3-dioxygenase-like lactoylglutathione lyase family enzyme